MEPAKIIFIVLLCTVVCIVWALRSKDEDIINNQDKEERDEWDKIKAVIYEFCLKTGVELNEKERSLLALALFRMFVSAKSESYKEGFWNGQHAQIETIPMDIDPKDLENLKETIAKTEKDVEKSSN